MTHFLGLNLGLASNRSGRGAMQVPVPYCDVVEPNEDDVTGIDVLYGAHVELTCSNPSMPSENSGEVVGSVPFDVHCSAVGDQSSAPTNATWSFGDGSAEEGVDVVHRLSKADNVKLWATVEGDHATCGHFSQRVERFTYIRACDLPEPSFEHELYRDKTYQLFNHSDVSVFGCHQNVQWLAFDETGEQVFESFVWEPRVTFEQDGVYTLKLRLTGLAGDVTVEQVLDTSKSPTRPFTMGNGCNSAVGGAGAGAFLVVLLLGFRRRRRV
jgi:MYXO-CTERM domain-containing protein